jgi:hypothetical protein
MSQPIILSEGRDQQVLRGVKTETRRLAKKGDYVSKIGDLWETDKNEKLRLIYKKDDTVALIPGRGKKATGRARIVALRIEPLLDITEEGARAEGVASRDEYLALWDKIQRTVPKTKRRLAETNPLVRVITLSKYV